jgi:predicted membrane-bound mannosyltransferase
MAIPVLLGALVGVVLIAGLVLLLRRSLRPAILGGLMMMLAVTPALVLIGMVAKIDWPFLAAAATFVVGLVVLGQVLAPGRSSFRAGSNMWQNEPGGGT